MTVTVNVPDGYTMAHPNPIRGKGRRESVGTFRNWTEAEAAEGQAKAAIRQGTYIPIALREAPNRSRITTVADAVAVWFDTKRGSITSNSASGYESAIRLHIVPALGDREVTTLTHDDMQSQVNAWRDSGMALGSCTSA